MLFLRVRTEKGLGSSLTLAGSPRPPVANDRGLGEPGASGDRRSGRAGSVRDRSGQIAQKSLCPLVAGTLPARPREETPVAPARHMSPAIGSPSVMMLPALPRPGMRRTRPMSSRVCITVANRCLGV